MSKKPRTFKSHCIFCGDTLKCAYNGPYSKYLKCLNNKKCGKYNISVDINDDVIFYIINILIDSQEYTVRGNKELDEFTVGKSYQKDINLKFIEFPKSNTLEELTKIVLKYRNLMMFK